MPRAVGVILIFLSTIAAMGQSSKYQVGTITDVRPHQTSSDAASSVTSYDVSLKVDDTIYVVLYTPPLGMITVRSAAGRELLVLVGKKTITYNDLLGNSLEAPIISRKPAAEAKQPK